MKNEKILELLNSNKVEELKELLVQEIKLEGYQGASTKTNINKVYKHLKKVGEKRFALQYCCMIDNHQVFTDSYFAVKLAESDFNPLIEVFDSVKSNTSYPEMKFILAGGVNKPNFTIDCSDFLDMIHEAKAEAKAKNKDYIFLSNLNKHLGIKVLDLLIASLNLSKKSGIITIYNDYNNPLNPVGITKFNGSLGIICPVRAY